MKSFVRELLGGAVLMLVAALTGIAVNAVRPDGLPLIQQGVAVETAQHHDEPTGATPDTSASAAEANLPEGAVSLEEMKLKFDAGTSVIIDARSTAEYEQGHIPGAINLPHDRIPEFIDMLMSQAPMSADVVCYCRSFTCDFSDLLATELKIMGFENVSVFSGGWEQWSGAGYPAETGRR